MEDKDTKQLDNTVERMQKIEAILDEYECKLGLPKFNEEYSDSSAYFYLKLSRDQMEKLTIEQCAEAALTLSSLASHIQRAVNRETSRITWAKNYIKEIVCKTAHQYAGRWEHQEMQAIMDNDVARKLHDIQKYAQQRVDRLTYVSSGMKSMGDVYINLQRSKVTLRNG